VLYGAFNKGEFINIMAKFQMVGSENPNTIAHVSADVDVEAFRKDPGWYEIKQEIEEEVQKEEAKVVAVRKGRPPKKEIQE